MPYDFLIGNKSNYSEDPSKKKQTYQESLRTKLTMDPKAMFLASPPIAGAGLKEPKYPVDFPSIRIGNQIWTSQNLDITTLYDGTDITYGNQISETPDALWTSCIENGTPLWCWREFDDDGSRYGNYGKWYSSTTVQKLITNPPTGWRVPSISDWAQLRSYFGNQDGYYIKGPDNLNLWDTPEYFNTLAKFNAVPSGISSIELAIAEGIFPPIAIGTYNAKYIASHWTSDMVNYSIYYITANEPSGYIETFSNILLNGYGFTGDGKYGMAPIRLIAT